MTTHSEEITMHTKRSNVHLRKENLTPEKLKEAQERTAHAREQKKIKQAVRLDLVANFDQRIKAYEAKIANLEHQAAQYRTVIDYLETKIEFQRTTK